MIIVGGSFEVEPSEREAFVAGRLDAMRASRAEEGCLEYTIAPDPVDSGRVVLFERWENQVALDAHLAVQRSDQTAATAPPRVEPTSVSIMLYEVSETRRLA